MKRVGLEAIRIFLSGIAAGIFWFVGILLIFGPAQAILSDPERQSGKFLAAFTAEPLPRMAERPEVLAYGLLIVGLIQACVYAWIHPKLTGNILRRGCTFGVIAWALMVPWFEFYLPWNVMLEPFALVILESVCWFIVLLAVGLSIASVHGLLGRRLL